mgnify:CR=1 FL=1
MPLTTRELFARLIKCEAGGEGDNGMRAVASVIMNRVHVSYGEYMRLNQGNLRNVMMQPGQFTCFSETVGGEYNMQSVYNMRPEQVHYDIADWALGGGALGAVGNCLWYFNPYTPTCPQNFPNNGTGLLYVHIGDHCFYTPTALYAQT